MEIFLVAYIASLCARLVITNGVPRNSHGVRWLEPSFLRSDQFFHFMLTEVKKYDESSLRRGLVTLPSKKCQYNSGRLYFSILGGGATKLGQNLSRPQSSPNFSLPNSYAEGFLRT